MKRGILIGLLALFVLLCTCTVGSAVQEQNENGLAPAVAGSMMEVEANKKDEEELQDAEASEDDATELMELQEQSEAELERRKKGGGRSRGGRSRGGRSGWTQGGADDPEGDLADDPEDVGKRSEKAI